MFLDPIAFTNHDSVAWALPAGAAAASYARVGDGEYSLQTATVDEPRKIVIQNSPPTSNIAPTRFALNLWQFKNAPAGSYPVGANPQDDFLQLQVAVRYTPRSFVANDILKLVNNAYCLTNPTMIAMLMRGEK